MFHSYEMELYSASRSSSTNLVTVLGCQTAWSTQGLWKWNHQLFLKFFLLIHNLFSKLMGNHFFCPFSIENFKILKVCALFNHRGRNIFLIHKNLLQWPFLPASVGQFTAHSATNSSKPPCPTPYRFSQLSQYSQTNRQRKDEWIFSVVVVCRERVIEAWIYNYNYTCIAKLGNAGLISDF